MFEEQVAHVIPCAHVPGQSPWQGMRNTGRPSRAWLAGGWLQGLRPPRSQGSRHPLQRVGPGAVGAARGPGPFSCPPQMQTPAWAPVCPKEWGGPSAIQQRSLSIDLTQSGLALGVGGCCGWVLGAGSVHPHPHQLHHLPASLPAWLISFPPPNPAAGRDSQTGGPQPCGYSDGSIDAPDSCVTIAVTKKHAS